MQDDADLDSFVGELCSLHVQVDVSVEQSEVLLDRAMRVIEERGTAGTLKSTMKVFDLMWDKRSLRPTSYSGCEAAIGFGKGSACRFIAKREFSVKAVPPSARYAAILVFVVSAATHAA